MCNVCVDVIFHLFCCQNQKVAHQSFGFIEKTDFSFTLCMCRSYLNYTILQFLNNVLWKSSIFEQFAWVFVNFSRIGYPSPQNSQDCEWDIRKRPVLYTRQGSNHFPSRSPKSIKSVCKELLVSFWVTCWGTVLGSLHAPGLRRKISVFVCSTVVFQSHVFALEFFAGEFALRLH